LNDFQVALLNETADLEDEDVREDLLNSARRLAELSKLRSERKKKGEVDG
jgi:hypothetical protein